MDWITSLEELPPAQEKGLVSNIERKTLRLKRDQKIAVHLFDPSFGYQPIHKRKDGVLCSGLMQVHQEEQVEEINSPDIQDLIEIFSTPAEDINTFDKR